MILVEVILVDWLEMSAITFRKYFRWPPALSYLVLLFFFLVLTYFLLKRKVRAGYTDASKLTKTRFAVFIHYFQGSVVSVCRAIEKQMKNTGVN